MLQPKFAANPEYLERFTREAHIAARLSHNNIVQAIDVGSAGSLHYFVMEYVEGTTIKQQLGERFLRTLKQECTRVVAVVPQRRRALCRESQLYRSWYNAARPHTTLAGATPDEVYLGRRPACRMPHFEPRPAWPRASRCAKSRVLVKGQPGVLLAATVHFPAGRRHLPHLILSRAA